MIKINLPQLVQTYEYDCGAKALQCVLVYYGINIKEGTIIKMLKTNTSYGTKVESIIKFVSKKGLKVDSRQMTLEDVKSYLKKKIPVILRLQAWSKKKEIDWSNDWSDGHYVIAIGYLKDKIIFEDPYSFLHTYLKYNELEKRWHDVENNNKYFHHGIAIFGKSEKYTKDKLVHMD